MAALGRWLLAIILAVVAVALIAGGVQLLGLGGSAYYLIAGLAVGASALAILRRSSLAPVIFGAMLLGTLAWSLWEAGLDGWALAPRLIGPAVVGLLFLPLKAKDADSRRSKWWIGAPVLAIAATLVLTGAMAVLPERFSSQPATPPNKGADGPTEWLHWGKDVGGGRFVNASQIDTGNVGKLELAWRNDAEVPPQVYLNFEVTPLAADGRLYACVRPGIVEALDPDTGKLIWRYETAGFKDIDFGKVFGGKCRGVALYRSQGDAPTCKSRIVFATPLGELRAVDAATGRPCEEFGDNGAADLREGMGFDSDEVLAMPTSAPTIVNGVIVVGQTVTDLGSLDAPPGVIRGYDAETGDLLWAWDAGRPGQTLLKEGETYTRDTPNAWGPLSGDEDLGLVFVPTGNSLPDYYGGNRPEDLETYASSVVALDVKTGLVRWSFQTTHHDMWDYDVASQPVVADIPGPDGAPVPALIQPTKTGQIFVLDRRTGVPVDPVEERPVPQGGVPGERTAPTQPFTKGFPILSGPDFTEKDSWGITPLDQMLCRIEFKQAKYEGMYTPTGLTDTLMFPGTAGGINWGSVTIDPARGLMMVNTLRFANFGRLIRREDAPTDGYGGSEGWAIFEQKGTPYAFAQRPFMSPLGVPCLKPPYGTIHVFDIATRKPVWEKTLGTAAKSGPFGIESHLPIRMGVPNMGGSVATAGGVAFIGAAQDRKLRAFDIGTGRELWSADLPAVAAATPMTYVSPKTGRQYVVIAAGGHYGLPGPPAAAIMAFALPRE
ncbi:MAG: PQQ-binding-like beta-propeller repeat protein [Novosphingobium sp.]|nr:PQQ-binding-like beta-propeller repeat protein [Novosphingobium sp.]